jgi:hypothetical protein
VQFVQNANQHLQLGIGVQLGQGELFADFGIVFQQMRGKFVDVLNIGSQLLGIAVVVDGIFHKCSACLMATGGI